MGKDSIRSFVLKECDQQLSSLIFEFFLRINKTRQRPSRWKKSVVTPRLKTGSTSDVSNYRPISILPKLSIDYERLTFNFIYYRVCSKIKREQHGVMKIISTVTQLISHLDNVYAAKDTNQDCLTLYFDVTEAFDSVSHGLLLPKLSSFGFDRNLLMLFQPYLIGQKQVVKVAGCFSSEVLVTSGVPQDNVLGPFSLSFLLTMLQTQYDILNIFSIAMTLNCFLFPQSTKFKMI